jgi:outer membrane protein OmpA-like peptidoglycan-associated protein
MADDQRQSDFFWPSYVDLMTSLFIVMLVLFVYSFKLFRDREESQKRLLGELKVKAQELEQIQRIRESLRRLEGDYFRYDPQNERYELRVDVQFKAGRDEIQDQYRPALLRAGRLLQERLRAIQTTLPVRYLVIVEGMAARHLYDESRNRQEEQFSYQLSYRRALNLSNLWVQNGLNFNQNQNIELIIGGSGFYGSGRYPMQRGQEERNKRFLIQIIPKIGKVATETVRVP